MLTAIASAADQQATVAAKQETYTGTIMSVEPTERVLHVKGMLMSKRFNLGDNCSYALWDKSAGAITDLRPGEKVAVNYQNAHGVMVADRVEQIPMKSEGTVKTVDLAANTFTLHFRTGDKLIQAPKDCRIVLGNNKSAGLAAIKPGDYVTVTYEETLNGKLTARQIALTSEKFTGEVVAVDLTDHTLKAKGTFGEKKFNVGDNCTIIINGKTDVPLNEVKLGDRLEFSYDAVNGVNVASRIATTPQEMETTSTQPMYP
jgi:Cu/Ag efflux protein CusF